VTSILALHGFLGSARDWDGAPCALSAIDLPGHGGDPAADPEAASFHACRARIGEALSALPRPRVLLGYSMGGRVALDFACARPSELDALILVSATPGLADSAARAARVRDDEALAREILRDGTRAFAERWARLPLIATQDRAPAAFRAAQRERQAKASAPGLAASLRGAGQGAMRPLWGELPTLRLPVLLVVGEADEKFVSIGRAMAGRLPDAELLVVPRAGHSPCFEAPEPFWAAVTDFLSRRLPSR
jgi:2-succinyl-6-hydroxy-2,4-cyclohexadiene-1-carboxylate synthase